MGKTRIRTLNPFKPLLLIFRTVVSFQGCSPDLTKVFFVVLAAFETETEMVCLEGKLRSKNLDLTWPGRQFSSFKQQSHPFQSCSINRSWVSKWLNMWYIHNWLVVWNMAWLLFSISYMGCHPSHWRTPSFFKMVIAPPTRTGFGGRNPTIDGHCWRCSNHTNWDLTHHKKNMDFLLEIHDWNS